MTHGGSSECGTPWAVERHKREGTDPCPEDLEARRAYGREWAARRRKRMAEAAAAETRGRGPATARERFEASVMAAHESGELVLG